MGGPPVEWWMDAYFRWLGRPYYLALQTAAASHGSSPQAIQVAQVMTDLPLRDLRIGRVRVHFFLIAFSYRFACCRAEARRALIARNAQTFLFGGTREASIQTNKLDRFRPAPGRAQRRRQLQGIGTGDLVFAQQAAAKCLPCLA